MGKLFVLWRYIKIDTVQFPDSRIGVVGGVDCRAHVFNKAASPVFVFLMVWKLIFSCSLGLFNCLVEKFYKEPAVTCQLIHCGIACARFRLVPGKRIVVGENIQCWKKVLMSLAHIRPGR